jgi:hypothetical protein
LKYGRKSAVLPPEQHASPGVLTLSSPDVVASSRL